MLRSDEFIKCPTCKKPFKKNTPWHRYCCTRCRLVAWIKKQL